ncbi:MOSC domain-containing protein YiiM [Paenibacillus endophyticus]|uniref:MOSC domain-containing protein YiiM n=1 Tax=Paenibacillus endophyticus TaxID=1294268 RepID=A0A7W5C3S3_9BACL|nr:MOSC domain-containing protein [Paenibacillus endophyticus]MBB3150337.1 MOSC domain-containing protein YiiM [Paenibacillus endophyticus]
MQSTLADTAAILSLNVGQPIVVEHKNKDVRTAIYKHPVLHHAFLSKLNFEGDGQADLEHHGGTDKAVCVYPIEHYAYWESELGAQLSPGAFGENLTTKGMLESQLCIGDIFRLGDAIVQVSQPRQPCFKLSIKFNMPTLPLLVQTTGFTGYYFRVLQEGFVPNQAELTLIERHPDASLTVSFANRIMHMDKQNNEGIDQLLANSALSASWRKTFTKRKAGQLTDSSARLNGK